MNDQQLYQDNYVMNCLAMVCSATMEWVLWFNLKLITFCEHVMVKPWNEIRKWPWSIDCVTFQQ